MIEGQEILSKGLEPVVESPFLLLPDGASIVSHDHSVTADSGCGQFVQDRVLMRGPDLPKPLVVVVEQLLQFGYTQGWAIIGQGFQCSKAASALVAEIDMFQ